MNPRDRVNLVTAVAVWRDTLKEADVGARSELLTEMATGDRLAAQYDGHVFGAASKVSGRLSPSVSDPDAFAAFVAEHYPTEVVTKVVVRPAFQSAVLEASRKAGEPCTPDGRLDVPGVTVTQGDPYLVVKPTSDAGQVVARMVADGFLSAMGEVRQIEDGAS